MQHKPFAKPKSIFVLLGLLFGFLFTGCEKKNTIDLLVLYAKIYSMDEKNTIYEAMAIKDGKIVSLGKAEALQLKYEALQTYNAQGNVILPGLIDAHSHFLGYAKGLQELNLFGTKSPLEIVQRTKLHAKERSEGWIIGRGWDQNDWEEKKFPDKFLLDSIFPDRPVFLARVDGHAALVNSKALELAGINKGFVVSGGQIMTLPNGQASGILIDNAVDLVSTKIPVPKEEQWKRWIQRAQQNCFQSGLTTVCDAGLYLSELKTLQRAEQNGDLKIGVYVMLKPEVKKMDSVIASGPFLSDRLRVCSYKFYADGALGSRGAFMKKEYEDHHGNVGLQLTTFDSLKYFAQKLSATNFQMNTHCIGDSANAQLLHLYAEVLKPGNDLRWRIEHAQVVSAVDMPLFKQYNIIPSVQPVHATSDMYWAEKRLGKLRILDAYAYKSLMEQNGWLAGGSDFPVEAIHPFLGIYAAVARRDTSGYPYNGFNLDQALTMEQALRAFTNWAAKACRMEKEKGSLEEGKQADFIVIDRDPFYVPLGKIPHTKVLRTFVKGSKVAN
jgi:predicted amidohydrolase YtcJ